MSTFIVAAILVGIVAGVCLLVVSLDKKQKRKALNQLLSAFRQAGSEHNLAFSSQEILKDLVIGLDGVHRKLLVLKRVAPHAFTSFVIDLHDVKSCSVKREYGPTYSEGVKSGTQEQYLQKIALHFSLFDKPTVNVDFYNHVDHHIFEIEMLEAKAKHWEAILSKMVAPLKKIA